MWEKMNHPLKTKKNFLYKFEFVNREDHGSNLTAIK